MDTYALVVEKLREAVETALKKAIEKGELPEAALPEFIIEVPADNKNGDFATNAAMAGARSFRMPPFKVAQAITANIDLDGTLCDRFETAGPGFINFFLGDRFYTSVIREIIGDPEGYGCSDYGKGEKVNVEFVSANPTGPMHMGNARGGALGDCLAAVLSKAGYDAYREFYVNDAGNQVDKFGRSIDERYRELLSGDGDVRANLQRILDLRAADSDWEGFPEDAYHGLDIVDLAMEIIERDGNKYLALDEEARKQAFISYGLPKNIALMKEHLLRYGIEFDNWFLESSLHESGYVAETVDLLTENGHTYEKDGALWLRNTAFGAEKDEVLRRSNGFYTYYAVDLAYHRNKFVERGFDRVIDVWGADHHGHAIRFGKSMTAPELGLQGKKLDFLIMQMVRLTRDGETVKVSKRSGKALTLNDLLDEIGVDACRFFFNAKPDTHLEFDLDLAVRQDSENPVYYVQYAHARICSLLATLAAEGHPVPPAGSVNAALLREPQELDLLKQLAAFPEEILMAARDYDPSRVNRYAIELAARFHRFYNACRIRGAEEDVMGARLALSEATRSVICSALTVIGVSAPEKM